MEVSPKVVALRADLVTAIDEPDAECIAMCEQLLEEALTGQIVSVAVATIGPQKSIGTGWKGNANVRDTAAAIALLSHRFMASWHEHPD